MVRLKPNTQTPLGNTTQEIVNCWICVQQCVGLFLDFVLFRFCLSVSKRRIVNIFYLFNHFFLLITHLQGDTEREIQPDERREPCHRFRTHTHARTKPRRHNSPQRHPPPEAGGGGAH